MDSENIFMRIFMNQISIFIQNGKILKLFAVACSVTISTSSKFIKDRWRVTAAPSTKSFILNE